MKTQIIQTTISVIHEVADFEKWHTIYLENSNPNSRIGVLRNMDNPNIVFVGERTDSHEAAKAFFASEDLQAAMKEGGVVSKPEIRFLNLTEFNAPGVNDKFRVSVSHEVADFDKWKLLFDADEGRRQSADLKVSGLGTSEDNPSEVFIVFATNDIDRAKAIFNDPSLKDMMKEAGVTSAPEFNYWKSF